MTPLEIEILFHYNSRATDYRDGDFSALGVSENIESLSGHVGLLRPSSSNYRLLELTEKGKVYIEALCNVPMPVQKWVMPDSGK